ncbi:MAG TPA: hypothetical protein VNA89_10310 [Gemmatimonadaceae bacterium]|nr:hypothetical protein [Gemmatimonadaceae bacterium]
MTDLVYSLSFADGLEAAEFLSGLSDYEAARAGSGDAGEVVAWIRDPLVRSASGSVCCVYLSAGALAAAREMGFATDDAKPLGADELPADRIAVVGDSGSSPSQAVGGRGPPPV